MNLRKNISNIFGWSTKKRYVVFESDDWGSIRTKSNEDYQAMLRKGLAVDSNFFTRYDSLESNHDLERLFDLLLTFKDATGRPPVFTPMCLVANPDFEKIKQADYHQYFNKTISQTVLEYPHHSKLLQLWNKGVENRLFVPALHGREHLHVARLLKGLQDRANEGLRIAAEHSSIGATSWSKKPIIEYLGAFHPDTKGELPSLENIATEASELFEKTLGYKPAHFIAPNREGPVEIDEVLAKKGVNFLTLPKLRKYPLGNDKYKLQINWWGKKNRFGQTLIMRNCAFEPSDPKIIDYADKCLAEINNAFFWNKPAVISSHRVNYIGYIDQKNADSGLQSLKYLLKKILHAWPDAEFLTSTELGNIITNKSS